MDEEQITVSEEEIEQLITLSQESNSEQLVTVTQETGVGGTKDYNKLNNKPQINDVELIGNKSFEDLGAESLTNIDIENIINSIV